MSIRIAEIEDGNEQNVKRFLTREHAERHIKWLRDVIHVPFKVNWENGQTEVVLPW